ncbi:MAG: nicotinamide mononucleotide transporter [Bacteroidetes bacterium]|nr:nicotinamide mononucleotide transporter [Bacteroidota bacterium]
MMMPLEEFTAVVLGVLAVYLSTKQNVWTYPLGIISVFIYIDIFYEVKLYADMGLQVFFIALLIYGWHEWLYGGENKTELHVSKTPKKIIGGNIFFVVSATGILGYSLHQLTDASLPYVDSFLAVLSMSGQYLQARKYLGNWSVWVAVNTGSIAMYEMKGLYFTMALYGVYLALAILGYREWKNDFLRKNSSTVTFDSVITKEFLKQHE